MDLKSLYAMSCKSIRGALIVRFEPRLSNEETLQLFRGEIDLPSGTVMRFHMGGEPRDVIPTSSARPDLYSEDLVKALKEGNFTGWKATPVKVYPKDGRQVEGYSILSVPGRCGPIDDRRSVRAMLPTPGGKEMEFLVGVHFDEATWDGSGIFNPEGTGYMIVTEAVKRAIESSHRRALNSQFTRLTEIRRSVPLHMREDR